ncbi:MAG: hypothetical protein SX243_06595 [Acidobacteriota bacterium]|nr:hypothetical protein [Acidobacteriota bacterium]
MLDTLREKAGLSAWLTSLLATKEEKSCVVQAGHFILVPGENARASEVLVDCGELPLLAQFSQFSKSTWLSACEALGSSLSSRDVELLVLVNDWQFLELGLGNRRAEARLADYMRRQYYSASQKIPSLHSTILSSCGLSDAVVFRNRPDKWMFSETDLRRDLNRSISGLFDEDEAAEASLVKRFLPTGDPVISYVDEDGSEQCLLYCGATSCSGEIVELLRRLSERSVDVFVNIFPRQCWGPVVTGTKIAHAIYGLSGMEVVNVAVPLSDSSQRPLVDIRQY